MPTVAAKDRRAGLMQLNIIYLFTHLHHVIVVSRAVIAWIVLTRNRLLSGMLRPHLFAAGKDAPPPRAPSAAAVSMMTPSAHTLLFLCL